MGITERKQQPTPWMVRQEPAGMAKLSQKCTGCPSTSASNSAPHRATTAATWNFRLGPAAFSIRDIIGNLFAWLAIAFSSKSANDLEWMRPFEASQYNCLVAIFSASLDCQKDRLCRQGCAPLRLISRAAASPGFPTRALGSLNDLESIGPEGGTPICQ